VVYLCDGFWDFSLVWAMYSHLLTDKAVPEYILVGLGYGGNMPDFEVLRLIDLHSISRRSEARNHTPDYLARLKNIIFPFVEREYAVDTTFQVLGGCSSGAAFAIAAMFAEPELFQAIIALSPLFDLRFAWLSKLEEEYFQKRRNRLSPLVSRASLPVRLFLGVGGEDSPQVKMEALRFNEHLDNRCYRGFQKELRCIDGERHCAVKPEGFNRGLRYVFAPFV
jgi:predicted alpha/beta superfamily hydrolase